MKHPRRHLALVVSLLGFALACSLTGCRSAPTPTPSPTAAKIPAAPVVAPAPSATAPTVEAPATSHRNTAIFPVPQRLEDRLPQNAVNNFHTRHERYSALAKQGGIDLLFLGDSITQGWGGPGQAVWKEFYGEMKAASFGIGYDRTQHVLWRLQNGEGEGFSPKVVVLMIGTNNIGLNPPAEIAEGIAAIVHELRRRFTDAKILLHGIFPRDFKGSRNRLLVAETNRLIAPLHDGRHVFYLDLAGQFIDADGNIAPDVIGNTPPLHPTAKGYAVWAEAIKAPLASLLAGGGLGERSGLPPKEKFHLFLLVGQSNMAGRGVVTPADKTPLPRVLMLNQADAWVPATDPMHFDKPASVGVGLGRTFGLAVAEANPGVTIGLIPCAVGGSPIDAWKPGIFYEPTNSHPWDDALRRAKVALQAGTLKGILWHQGESDSTAELAPGYEAKLHDLIARLRSELNAPNIPFVAGQLGRFDGSPWDAARVRVDQAQRDLPLKVPHTAFVSSEGLKDKGDKVHFDADSYREFGRRYAEAFLKLAREK